MSSKSLIWFTIVGVIAGLVLGLYLIDFKNTTQLVFVEGPSISIVTDKFDFKKNEEVKIMLVNSGTVPLKFADSSYGLQITGLSGNLIYTPIKIQESSNDHYDLDPHEEIGFVWNQTKNDGTPAHDGLYKIISSGIDSSGKKIVKSTTITIWK